MNITTIKKSLSNYDATKKATVIKTNKKGEYKVQIDVVTIAYITTEKNKIKKLLLTNGKTNEEFFSVLYTEHSFNSLTFDLDIKIFIENKEFNLYECEKLFGFLDYLKEEKEDLLEEIKNINSNIKTIKNKIENNNIKLKKLIDYGYTEREISPIKELIEDYIKRIKNNEQYLKVLNGIIEEIEKEKEMVELKKNEYENVIFEILKSENTKIDYSNGYELKIYNNKESFKFSVAKCYFTEKMTEEYTFDFTEGPNKNKRAKINIYTENYDIFVKEFNKEVNRLINK